MKKLLIWLKTNLFRENIERSLLLWLTLISLFFNYLVWFLFVPIVLSSLDNYQKFIGKSEYAESRMFIEPRGTKFGTQYDNVEKLVLKIEGFDQEFKIGSDYRKFWSQIKKYGNRNRTFVIYTDAYRAFENPMQIQVGDEILLPLSFHKKIAWYLIILFETLTILMIIWFIRILKRYQIKHRNKDRDDWKSGAKGKFRVIARFIFS